MSEKKYRTYTEEFKREALELLKSSGKSAGQMERELGITAGMLLKWRDRYQVVSGREGRRRAWSRVIWKRPNGRSNACSGN